MEEVDNIIIQTLRQIGCNIDENFTSLSAFSPDLLVNTISKCLLIINPALELPETLPIGMAQRYSVTTILADACTSIGFKGDIGYQTFLYSNVTEVRRVFMFLIERLPKESEKSIGIEPITDKISAIEYQIANNINLQLNAAWTPQYCKKLGIRRFDDVLAVQSSNHGFLPLTQLNIPHFSTKSNISQELREYWLKRSPNIFQQTNSNNLCSTLIHKNSVDCLEQNINSSISNSSTNQLEDSSTFPTTNIPKQIDKLIQKQNDEDVRNSTISERVRKLQIRERIRKNQSIHQLALDTIEIPNQNDIIALPEIRPLDEMNFDIEKLKQSIEQGVINRKQIMTNINDIKVEKLKYEQELQKLKDTKQIKERTHILLENPEVNIKKMGTVLKNSEERMKKLTEQWDAHRLPLIKQLEQSQKKTSQKYSETKIILDEIKSTREKSDEIEKDIKNKITLYSQFITEFGNIKSNKNRNAYTSRIFEIISNIRKQKSDIDKILLDTRVLQKEINTVSGQLDRQFTVTDDLLFKTAKKDESSKRAYKLLATLHSDCNELIKLVQDTGSIMREVRDLEDQIEQEKVRNAGTNLERITNDLKLIEEEGHQLQEKLKSIK